MFPYQFSFKSCHINATFPFLQKCDIILKEIWAHDESIPFVRPVDKKQVSKSQVNLSTARRRPFLLLIFSSLFQSIGVISYG